MSLTLPANQSGELSLAVGQTVDLGTPPPQLTDQGPFTVTGWFRVPEVAGTATAISEGSNFSVVFNNGVLVVTLGNGTVRSSAALDAGFWYHVGVVYNITDPGKSSLSLYIDGALISSTANPRTTGSVGPPPHLTLGGGNTVLGVRRVTLWSIALTEPQVLATRFAVPSSQPGLQGAWNFAIVPAQDGSGNNRPITYLGGAAQSVATPGLMLSGSGYASGSLGATDLNQTPFTIQTWVRFGAVPTANQWMICVGSGQTQVGLLISPSTAPAAGNANITFKLGGHGLGKVVKLDTNGWTNIAATHDPATGAASLYINGTLALQSVTPIQIGGSVSSAVTLGAEAGGGSGFNGMIQTAAIWPSVLSAEDIQGNLYPIYPGDDLPLEVFDFTIEPASQLIAGERLTLKGTTLMDVMLLPAADVAPQTQDDVEVKRKATRAKRSAAEARSLAGFKRGPLPPVDTTRFTPAAVERVVSAFQTGLPGVLTDEQRQQFHATLESVFAKAREGDLPLAGMFRTERIGADFVTFFHDRNGTPQAVMKSSAAELTPCAAWMIDMAATAIFGVLSLLDVPVTPGVVTKSLKKLFKNNKVYLAIATVLADEITTMSYVACVKALYDTNYLKTFVKDILSDLSWWDFLWMVSELIIELVALFFQAAELAILLGKLALTVAQLIQKATECPPNCP
jgi:hypothetical protein